MNKTIQNKDKEIEKLQKTNEMLTQANGQLLQQVAMGYEEPEKEEKQEEKVNQTRILAPMEELQAVKEEPVVEPEPVVEEPAPASILELEPVVEPEPVVIPVEPTPQPVVEQPAPRPTPTQTSLFGSAVEDIRQAISLGDRFLFQRELFAGNGELMQETLDELNALGSLNEAMDYVLNNFEWDKESTAVQLFENVLKRRFA